MMDDDGADSTRLRDLKGKISDQRKSLDDLEKHMYVPFPPRQVLVGGWTLLIYPVTT